MGDSEGERGGCGPLTIAATILALPILYFLSSGPAYLLGCSGYIDGDTYRAIYWPLVYVSQLSPSIRDGWSLYLQLWGG